MRMKKENLKLLSIILAAIAMMIIAGCQPRPRPEDRFRIEQENCWWPPANRMNDVDKNHGAIVGRVEGAPAGTWVTCVNEATGFQRSHPIDREGNFRIAGLPQGSYTCTVGPNPITKVGTGYYGEAKNIPVINRSTTSGPGTHIRAERIEATIPKLKLASLQ